MKTHRLQFISSSNTRRLKGFTLIELLTVIAIIGVLAGILIPAIGKVRERALLASKTSAYRQYYVAHTLYASDNKGRLCPAVGKIKKNKNKFKNTNWRLALAPYLTTENERGTSTVNKGEIYQDPFFEKDEDTPVNVTGNGFSLQPLLPESDKENSNYENEADNDYTPIRLLAITHQEYRTLIGDVDSLTTIAAGNIDATRHEGGTKGMFVRFDGSIVFLDEEDAKLSITDPIKLRGR